MQTEQRIELLTFRGDSDHRRGRRIGAVSRTLRPFVRSEVETLKVAITGTLSKPREEIVRLIEALGNVHFSPQVTYDINYLIASRFDTAKAKRAAQIGITVISESEMMEFIERGSFPENQIPTRPPRHMPDFKDDEIT